MLRDHDRFAAEDRRFYDAGLTTMLHVDPPDHILEMNGESYRLKQSRSGRRTPSE